jgi:autotransporter-associated beta strand protein
MKPASVRHSSHSARAFATAITVLLVSHSAHAAIQTWDNGASNLTWDAASLNWSGAAWTNGNDAVFDTTGAGAITVSGTRILNNLTISAAGYSFTGGTLSLTNNTTTNNTWSIANDTNIASAVSLNTNKNILFNKTGTGKLLLSGPVTITGANSFYASQAGTVEFSGGLTATNTGIFALGGDVLISGGTNVLSGTTSRKGIVAGGNGGTFTVSGGTTTAAALNTANGSTGTYTQTNGSVTIKSDTNVSVAVTLGAGGGGATTTAINLDGGTLTALGMAASTGWLGTSTINLNGGTFKSGAANTNLFNTNVTGSGAGSIFVKSGGALIDTNSFAVTQSQALLAGSPSGGLTKSGAGTLTLSGENTYTGLTTVTGGALSVTGSLASTSTLTVGASGTANFANASQNLGAVSNSNTATSALNFSNASGTVVLASLTGAGHTRFGSNGTVTGGISTGTVTSVGALNANISGGTITAGGLLTGTVSSGTVGAGSLSSTSVTGGTNTITGAAGITTLNGGATTVGGVATIGTMTSGTANLNGSTSSISTLNGGTVNLGSTTLTVGSGTTSGAITGASGALTVTGALALNGSNTYGGITSVNTGGDLRVNGTNSGGGAVNVDAGANLGGSGSVIGGINVSGVLAPGNSIESLGGGALNFLTGSTYAYELQTNLFAGTPNVAGDLTYSSSTLSIASGTILTLTDLAASTALAIGSKLNLISSVGAWNLGIFSYDTGAGLTTLADDSTFTLGANIWKFDYNDTLAGSNFTGDTTGATNFVTMTVIPEPNVAALLGGLGVLALLRRRRK